ncbi:MAG: transcriptional repressor [Rhodospirillales bacterium CG15_BIG_FIL_POST_REV_8_21_14_020_66_15]|nr:MAG: transcriptional repressor [Rhodospirillales bacterium CG15_BIG_FIL_POST_REV_8_21_14_020_66_15]
MADVDADPKKLTRNQQAVLAALKGAGRPLTAYDVLGLPAIRKAGMKAPLTIYRALDKLIALGLVHRIESLNAFVHCGHGPHDHAAGFLICTDCGRTLEVHLESCENHLAGRARDQGFAVDDVRVEMTGRCPDCAGRAAVP